MRPLIGRILASFPRLVADAFSPHPVETISRPFSAALGLELETLFGDDHRVGSSMPFADKVRSRFDSRLSWGCDPPIALELGGETRQPPAGRLRQAAEGDLLNAIRERPRHEIATQARRLGAIEPPPFLTHRAEVEGLKSREPIRDVTAWRALSRRRRQISP